MEENGTEGIRSNRSSDARTRRFIPAQESFETREVCNKCFFPSFQIETKVQCNQPCGDDNEYFCLLTPLPKQGGIPFRNCDVFADQDDAMKDSSLPQSSVQIPEQFRGLSVNQIQEMAQRQQQQIDAQQQMLVAKEQRLKYLRQQDLKQRQMASEYDRLRRLREKVEAQELKLRKLRALRGQTDFQQRGNNNPASVTADLDSIRALFNEKEKELSLAVKKVEELTHQLEDLRTGRLNNHYNPQAVELERLRRELAYRKQLNEQQNNMIAQQRAQLAMGQDEMRKIDNRIMELQERLSRKRMMNQQLASQINAATTAKQAQLRAYQQGMNKNKPISTVEPFQRHVNIQEHQDEFQNKINKNDGGPVDPKYQTLPFNTKFMQQNQKIDQLKQEKENNNVQFSEDLPSPPPTLAQQQQPPYRYPDHQGNYESKPVSSVAPVFQSQPKPRPTDLFVSPQQNANLVINDSSSPSFLHQNSSTPNSSSVQPPESPTKPKPALPPKPVLPSDAPPPYGAPPKVDTSQEAVESAMASLMATQDEGTSVDDDGDQSMLIENNEGGSDGLVVKLDGGYGTSGSGAPNVHISINRRIEMPPAFHFPEGEAPPSDLIGSDSTDNAAPAFPIMSQIYEEFKSNEDRFAGKMSSNDESSDDFYLLHKVPDVMETDPVDPRFIKSIIQRKEGSQDIVKTHENRVSFDPLALLLDASLEGELDLVKKTAREVTNPSAANDEGITALHNAICAGHFDIVKFLVEFGCDVNAQDSDGWTPLHCAASCNNLPMVRFLVEHGACIFATTLSDHETAAEKCEEDEEGFDGCSEYLYSTQEKLGIMNNGVVYAVYDFEQHNSDELSFRVSDKLVVLRKGDDFEREWWWSAKGEPAKEGYVPRNLLGLHPRVEPQQPNKQEEEVAMGEE